LEGVVNRIWYGKSRAYMLLIPFSWLFALLAAMRRKGYSSGLLNSYGVPVPVIVVGNITVGGTGKTPVTLWLAKVLQSKGMQPAIISRGYGGKTGNSTVQVFADSDPGIVGDEALLLAKGSGCPVFVDANRVEAAEHAVNGGADVIISDDGLQHYRLRRDVEIVVIDGSRGMGNGHLLPAGPLRERQRRLKTVDRILIQQEDGQARPHYGNRAFDIRTTRFTLAGETLYKINDEATLALKELANQSVHAVAGIANPERFFRQLERHGLKVIPHPMPDHAEISAQDVRFDDSLAVVVTEKDAVKCKAIAHDHLWYLPVDLEISDDQEMEWIGHLHEKLLASSSQEAK